MRSNTAPTDFRLAHRYLVTSRLASGTNRGPNWSPEPPPKKKVAIQPKQWKIELVHVVIYQRRCTVFFSFSNPETYGARSLTFLARSPTIGAGSPTFKFGWNPVPNVKILVEPRACVIPWLELLFGLPAMKKKKNTLFPIMGHFWHIMYTYYNIIHI